MELGWSGHDGTGPLKLFSLIDSALMPKLWLNIMEEGSGPLSLLFCRPAQGRRQRTQARVGQARIRYPPLPM